MKIWKILTFTIVMISIIGIVLSKTQSSLKPRRYLGKPKVATTNLAADEIVHALLSEQGELNRWVGHSELATNPEYSHLSKEDIYAKTQNIAMVHSVESILSTKPDLVIMASFNRKELIEQVKALGMEVLLLDRFASFEDIKINIKTIGKKIGAAKEAEILINQLDSRVLKLKSKPLSLLNNQAPSFILFSESAVVMGKQTSLDSMISLLGGRLIPAELGIKGWGQLNDEALANAKPDFVISTLTTADETSLVSHMKSFGAWRFVDSLKADTILKVPHKDLLSVSHHFVTGLESLYDKTKIALRNLKIQQPSIKTKEN
jgi:ABC-type Fe3+-hydroxamate transport system substrate-binding protein